MENSEKTKTPEKMEKIDLDKGGKRPKFLGSVYIIIGILGLAATLYSGYYDLYNIVPLFGTVVAGILTGAVSVLIIAYGYRMIRKDL